jgi:hypothetical protein
MTPAAKALVTASLAALLCATSVVTAAAAAVKTQPVVTTTAIPSATAGNPIADTAVLSGATSDASGTMTFSVYGPDDTLCTGLATPAGVRTVSGGNTFYNSDVITLTAPGLYRWVAAYSGDANNNGAVSVCNAPGGISVITQAWTVITGRATTTAPVGGTLQDVATTIFENGTATGTITFSLYGPNDATCSAPAVSAGTVAGPFTDLGSYSSSAVTVTAPGTYRWIASYSGDLRTKSFKTACNDPGQVSVVLGPTILGRLF